MSYILDALKKAERDRGITKIPALLTVHDLRPPGRNYRWAVAAIAVACGAALGWYLLNSRAPVAGQAPQPGLEQDRAASLSESERIGASEPPNTVPPATELQPSERAPLPGPRPESGAAPPRQPLQTAVAPAGEGARGASPTVKPGGLSRLSLETGAAVAPPGAAANSARPAAGAPPAASSPAAAAATTTASLREAVGRMSITVLVYAEGKAERLVFINGRKYTEGDLVDELYLLESIRPDGAVLSYGGEREVLRPGPK